MSEPMMAMVPCEYCGRSTPWDLRICVPACCPACGNKPLLMAGLRLVGTILIAFAGAVAYFAVTT